MSPSAAAPSGISASRPKEKNRAPEVDLIRVLSASLLFYFHTGVVNQWVHYQWTGYVTGTFIPITTYCALRWSRHRHRLLHHGFSGARSFISDRFRSLYPVYVFFCLLIFSGSYFYPPDGHNGPFSLGELVLSLLMVNQYVGLKYFTDPMWFVPFVLQVYLLVPVLCRFTRWPMLGMAGCTVISLLLCIGVSQIAGGDTAVICNAWSPLLRLPLVFLGITFATAPWSRALGSFAVYAAGVVLGLFLIPVLPGLEYVLLKRLYSMNAMITILTLAIAGGWAMRASLVRWDWLALLGQAALPFFLSHGVMIRFIHKRLGSAPGIWIAYFVACWLGSVLFVKGWQTALQKIRARTPETRGPGNLIETAPVSSGGGITDQ